jgi:hypothetical protein
MQPCRSLCGNDNKSAGNAEMYENTDNHFLFEVGLNTTTIRMEKAPSKSLIMYVFPP